MSFSVDVEEWHDYCSPYLNERAVVYSSEELRKMALLNPLRCILEVFAYCNVKSTFFVLGETAQRFPELVEGICDHGHEIASHSLSHRNLTNMSRNEFEKTEKLTIEILTRLAGTRPKGFRAPAFSISTEILNCLERLGYNYDSSVAPSIRIPGYAGLHKAPMHPYHPSRRDAFKASKEREFLEVPIAAFPVLHLPAGGGWLLRNVGVSYIKTAIKLLLKKQYPIVLYVHLQDLTLNPKTDGVPFHEFRNCGRYVLKAIRNIIQSVPVEKMPIREIVSRYEPPPED